MAEKIKDNISGQYYVDINCINCSICTEIAPEIFATNHDEGYEYIHRQPANKDEKRMVAELIGLCPANAIQDNG